MLTYLSSVVFSNPALQQSAHTLDGMARPRTISNEDILRIARGIFGERGHTATTREIAEKAGISEAILYQRFSSKDELFFASMRPTGPDIEALLGPSEPPDDARGYLRTVVVRISAYLSEVIPIGLHVMTHPSFDPAIFSSTQPTASSIIRDGLVVRLQSLADRNRLSIASAKTTARLLVSIAHDWALGTVLQHDQSVRKDRELRAMVDIVWQGLRVHHD